jgi:hypothetical protein
VEVLEGLHEGLHEEVDGAVNEAVDHVSNEGDELI